MFRILCDLCPELPFQAQRSLNRSALKRDYVRTLRVETIAIRQEEQRRYQS